MNKDNGSEFLNWYHGWYFDNYCSGMTVDEAVLLYERVHSNPKVQVVKNLTELSWNESRKVVDKKEFPFNNPFGR